MSDPRYDFRGYICGRACFKPSPFEGWATFDQIFITRPSDCRFGVALDTDGNALLWDLYAVVNSTTRPGPIGPFKAPRPVRVGLSDELPALIMQARLTYDQD